MTWREAYREFGRSYWADLVTRFESNVSAIGRAAGIRRNHVYWYLRKFGVRRPDVRPNPFAHRGKWDDLS